MPPIAVGSKDSNRRAIAAALAQFLGVEEALPESFEGIPVLNNQKSWFFPYAKDRDPAQIDALWQVFQSGLALAAADYLQLSESLTQRFEQPDFSVHSFPELSLEAWSYTCSAPDPAGGESADDVPAVSDGNDTPDVEPVTPLTPYCIDDILADGRFLPPSELERILRRLREKKNLILQGPPGTGKTWLAKRLGMALVGHLVQEPQLRSVQFHPNLSSEDFVRGWRPSANGGLALQEGVFMQMVKGALEHPSQTHVLVIEEINRDNPAQIFGELLTLLEAGKRTPRDAMQLCYPDPDGVHRPVHVPGNLYVIGTMNIADRSLALVDMAFRRRFAFVDLEPSLGTAWREWVVGSMQLEASAADTIQQRLEQLNSTITADSRLGKAFRIGHSTVTPSHSLDGRSSRDWVAEVVATELRPLLHEDWFDAPVMAEREADRLLEGW
jgi:5-methylcytosine-specific restriction protein B